jgi:uncharacterized protein (DUF1800 family)
MMSRVHTALPLSRRQALRAGVGCAAAAAALWHPQSRAAASAAPALAAHVLNRFAYGPRPGDLDRLSGSGVAAWLDSQLAPPPSDEGSMLPELLAPMDTLRQRHPALIGEFRRLRAADNTGSEADRQRARAALRDMVQRVQMQMRQARLLRALHSAYPLHEVMVEFWFNHFNVFAGKEIVRVLAGAYEAEAIRPHVFGRFRDMLGATAKHPAMLVYLDNAQSVADGNSRRPLANASGLNENYARELLELHTLGVDGGYTQTDVRELARVLTGWTFDRRDDDDDHAFRFAPARHDDAAKTLLGQPVPGRGQAQGEWALDLLARHRSTARHVATKLARAFVADVPPPALVQRLAERFTATDGDLRELVRTLATSAEFNDAQHFGAKFKTPYQYVVSAVRATGVPLRDARPLLPAIAQMGQPLYGCVTPDGWKDVREAWLSPDALAKRVAFAQSLSQRLNGRGGSTAVDAETLLAALGPAIGEPTRRAIGEAERKQQLAALLASPDFMRR